jgi:hypothetical protein
MFKELSRLFSSPARIKILKFFVFQPNLKIPSSAVASGIGIPRAVCESELRALVRTGVLQPRKYGKKVLYGLSSTYAYADLVRMFLEKITLPSDKTIADAFRGISGITLLVATGALTEDTRPSLDILIVTRRPKDTRITKAVRKVEMSVALPLRYAVLEPVEFAERREARDRILRDVFEFSYRVIVGKA